MTLDKPKSITVVISDRKSKKHKSFVIYGKELDEVERRIKKTFEK